MLLNTRTFSVGTFIVLLLAFTSCKEEVVRGKGEVVTQSRDLSGFDKVSVDMTLDAQIVVGEGEAFSVEVKAHENLHEHIKAEVEGNKLRIYKDGGFFMNDDIDVVLHMPALRELEIHGAADAEIQGLVSGNDFSLNVYGASDVEIDKVDVKTLLVKLAGASELDIKHGTADKAQFKVTGAGEIYADGMKTRLAKAKVSGAGEMSLYVTDTLEADITGAGEIDYKGHPHISSDVAGAGSLNDIN